MPDRSDSTLDAPASPLDAAQTLEDAADLLLIHGRCHMTRETGDGRLCVLGALSMVETGKSGGPAVYQSPAVAALAETIPARKDPWPGTEGTAAMDVAAWSDRTTDDDEVRDTLLLVAKDLRGQAVPDGAR